MNNSCFISKKDMERIFSQGKKEDMERLFEFQVLEFQKKKKRNGIIKVLNEYVKIENEDIPEEENFEEGDKRNKDKVLVTKVVDYLLTKFVFKTIYGKRDETIFLFEDGIYTLRGRELIKTKTEEILGENCSNYISKEIIEKIKRKTAIDIDDFNNIPINLICLKNGLFDLKENKLKIFDSKYYFKNRIPINYNPEEKIEKILKFFEEVCYPEDLPVIQEWFGFCLYRRYFIKKAIILFGEKNTGKTVLLNILIKFLGEKNISGISLHRIASKDKFALSSLKDKFSNVYDDLSSDDLKDLGGFKIATGGGYITAEHKFGDSFQFVTYAKNIFATNMIPNVKDINDDAYYERWIPLCFDNQIQEDKQNNFLFESITSEKEMSGLLNWSLIGLKRLLKKGKFSYQKDSKEIKKLMNRQNNPLISFVEEVLIQEDGNKITKEMMFLVYSKWCQNKKVPRLSKEQLGRNLAKNTNYLIAKGGKERIWENVRIISEYF